jgi:hypothetical protein
MLLAVVLFLVGFCLFFKVDRIPGDFLDARLNMYVLEHGYRWLIHLDRSFWSAPFFYPASNVITYSDNHLGSLLFYSVLRIFGASRESAFQLWVFTIVALNYFITWLVLKKQNFHPIGAIASAYLFTFPMIMAAQIIHMQLTPRFMVPVAFWMAYVFLECGKPRFLCLLFAACAYQIYLGIYIGYFLILSLVPFCVAIFLYRKQWIKICSFIANGGSWVALRRSIGYVGSCIIFVLALLPLIVPYYGAQQEMGRRTWDEVVQGLPRWQSYFYAAPGSILGKILHFGDFLPNPWEHQLFLGFLPYVSILIFLYLFLKGKMAPQERLLGLAMMSVLITLSVLTFYCRGFSLYRYVWAYFPGAGGIRAVTRVVMVLVYPIAFICGAIVTYLLNSRAVVRVSWITCILAVGILALVVMAHAYFPETGGIRTVTRVVLVLVYPIVFICGAIVIYLMNSWPGARASWMACILAMGILTLVVDQKAGVASMSKRECKRRIANMKAKIAEVRGNNLDRTILWVDKETDEPFLANHLDAMLAGQDLGLNVVNGYSGFKPHGYPQAMSIQTGDCCVELGFWAGLHPGTITNNSLIQIGSHCDIPKY